MTPTPPHQPEPTTPPAPAPPPRRRRPLSKTLLFALLALTLIVCAGALALTAVNIRGLRERIGLGPVLAHRKGYQTMASYPNVATPARRDHLRACYKDPEQIDFNKISWDLRSRPTPFLNYAPEPGDQGEGHFNAQQLRNRQDVALPKPPEIYRIFVIGGSHAYGAGVPTQDDTIPACLEKILNERKPWPGKRVEVFNAAVAGWTSTHERILAEHRIVDWQPDLVLALSGGNDAHWGFGGCDVRFFRTYEDEMYFACVNAAMRLTGAQDYPYAPPMPAPLPVAPAVVAQRFTRNMRLAALALESAGAPLVVALQPTLSPKAKTLSEGERRWLEQHEPAGKIDYMEQCFAAMAQALAAGGPTGATLDRNPPNLKSIKIRDVFAGRADAIYFDLFHMADKGNEIIARRIADELGNLPGVGVGGKK